MPEIPFDELPFEEQLEVLKNRKAKSLERMQTSETAEDWGKDLKTDNELLGGLKSRLTRSRQQQTKSK